MTFNNTINHLKLWCINKAKAYQQVYGNYGGITYVGYQVAYELEFKLSTLIDKSFGCMEDLKKEVAEYEDDLYFLKEFVAVRTRSGTGRNMYHTYGCPYLDDLSDITRIVLKTSDLSPCCDWCMRD